MYALEGYRLNKARKMLVTNRTNFYILRTDNNVYFFVGCEALVYALVYSVSNATL